MTARIEDDFELELRSLPGVVSVGIRHGEGGEVEAVSVLSRGQDPEAVRESAVQLASIYFPDVPVVVEEARDLRSILPERARVALESAGFEEHDGMAEVRLSHAGRVGIGRAGSGPLIGGAEATLSALRDLGYGIPFYLMTVTEVDMSTGTSVILTLRSLANSEDRMGIARWDGDIVLSAARATLDALNRYVSIDTDRQQAAQDAEALITGGA
ncbi:MAG: hypothetical protein ACLQOZ_15290 [Acidimicrobiales bacterium]|jgi:hypothetical protein